MNGNSIIKSINEKKADQLFDSLAVCAYCKTPFKECVTIIPSKGLIIGESDAVEYKNLFWHLGCILDYQKEHRKYWARIIPE